MHWRRRLQQGSNLPWDGNVWKEADFVPLLVKSVGLGNPQATGDHLQPSNVVRVRSMEPLTHTLTRLSRLCKSGRQMPVCGRPSSICKQLHRTSRSRHGFTRPFGNALQDYRYRYARNPIKELKLQKRKRTRV